MATFTYLPTEARNVVYNGIPSNPPINFRTSLSTPSAIQPNTTSYYCVHSPISISTPGAQSNRATAMPPTTETYLSFRSQLTICTAVGLPDSTATQEAAHSLIALTNIVTPFQILNLRFTSTVSKLLQPRVDDSVLHDTHLITYALRTILAFEIAEIVRVELKNVSFATGVMEGLRSEFGGRLEVSTRGGGEIERPLIGRYSTSHLSIFGFDHKDVEYVEDLRSEASCSEYSSSLSSSLGSALSELDTFCPMEYLDEESEDLEDTARFIREDSGFFEMDEEDLGPGQDVRLTEDLQTRTSDDEELDESDDIDDEEMDDIDDIDAIMGNLEEQDVQRVNESDVRYMTNFAPDLLGEWLEKTV